MLKAPDAIPVGVKPLICVWEITLACNVRCIHCGSTAGDPRPQELDTAEALQLIGDLAKLGCRSLTLSGGEPLIREDWPVLARAVVENGMRPELITNGLAVARQARTIAAADFFGVTFSIDGTTDTHDRLRDRTGALEQSLAGARALGELGVRIGAETQVSRLNIGELDAIHDLLVEQGFEGWQIQLTMKHGRAAKRDHELCLEPHELPRLEKDLLAIRKRSDLFIQIADNVGYMAKSEPILRAGTRQANRFWGACQAGLRAIGITSDGTVRGCLALPPAFDEGNIRDRPLAEIWEDPEAFGYNRKFKLEQLQGDCQGCAFGKVCRGGCTSLAYAATGNPHKNPFCLRAIESKCKTS